MLDLQHDCGYGDTLGQRGHGVNLDPASHDMRHLGPDCNRSRCLDMRHLAQLRNTEKKGKVLELE